MCCTRFGARTPVIRREMGTGLGDAEGGGTGRTLADRAFLSANPAAFRICRGVLSLTRTDESISMY